MGWNNIHHAPYFPEPSLKHLLPNLSLKIRICSTITPSEPSTVHPNLLLKIHSTQDWLHWNTSLSTTVPWNAEPSTKIYMFHQNNRLLAVYPNLPPRIGSTETSALPPQFHGMWDHLPKFICSTKTLDFQLHIQTFHHVSSLLPHFALNVPHTSQHSSVHSTCPNYYLNNTPTQLKLWPHTQRCSHLPADTIVTLITTSYLFFNDWLYSVSISIANTSILPEQLLT